MISLPREQGQKSVCAFLAVQEGCDRFCSYCVVPYTRGAEYSRPFVDIVAEAQTLVANGVREITLLSQNVNAYHDEASGSRLANVIHKLAELKGLLRIRYTTSHPLDMDDALIEAHRDVPKLMPFLHLPVQSGADTILEAMNRKHTADDYRRVVEKVTPRPAKARAVFRFYRRFSKRDGRGRSSTTMQIVRDIGYASAFSFKYSRRPGTPAAALRGRCPSP